MSRLFLVGLVALSMVLVGCVSSEGGSPKSKTCDPTVDTKRCAGSSAIQSCDPASATWSTWKICAAGTECAEASGNFSCLGSQPNSCESDTDCPGGTCKNNTCIPDHCNNGELDGDELYIDCGGSCPYGCPDGRPCVGNQGCEGGCCGEEGLCLGFQAQDEGAVCVCEDPRFTGELCESCKNDFFTGGACDEPKDTPMALIQEGLTFQFGSEAPCYTQAPEEDPCIATKIYNSSERHPRAWVKLSPFLIDVHEVTNFQYEYCEAMGECPKHNIINAVAASQAKYHLTDSFDGFPVVQVTYAQAEAYCDFVGKRLPTEFEWERVARGNPHAKSGATDRLYPAEGIGTSVLNCKSPLKLPTKYCRDDEIEAVPTSAMLNGNENGPDDHVIEESSTGTTQTIYHLFGNVAEWTSTFYEPDITCQDSSYTGDCKPCWDCGGDTDCKATCSDCPDCTMDDCSYLCTESATSYFQCQPQSSSKENPIKQADLSPSTAAKRVIRGGSVFDGTNKGCYARSSARDRVGDSGSLTPDRTQPYVGFRCVQDN